MPRRPPDNRTKTKAPPVLVNAVTPVPTCRLWTQEEATLYLNVSVRWLRDSACPKIRLPGNGRTGEPLIRYRPEDVVKWVDSWCTRSLRPSHGDAA
jgi:hypothetical protein